MSLFLQKCSRILEFIPFLLLPVFLLKDSQLHKHAINMSCQLMITVVVSVVFLLAILRFGLTRENAVLLSGMIWVTLIYIKQTFVPRP